MRELIRILHDASDERGRPFLLGFMDKYRIGGLKDCFEDPEKYIPLAAQYIREEGLA